MGIDMECWELCPTCARYIICLILTRIFLLADLWVAREYVLYIFREARKIKKFLMIHSKSKTRPNMKRLLLFSLFPHYLVCFVPICKRTGLLKSSETWMINIFLYVYRLKHIQSCTPPFFSVERIPRQFIHSFNK